MEGDSHRHININITPGVVARAVLVIALFWFLYFVRDLVVVILAALVIASGIEPIIAWLKRYRIARTLAVILIYLVLLTVLIGLFYFFMPSLLNDLSDLLAKIPTYFETISVWNPFNTGGESTGNSLVENLGLSGGFSFKDLINNFNTAFVSTSQGLVQTLSTLFGGLLSFVLIVVLSFYLAVQEDGVAKFLQIVLPSHHERYVIGLWRRSQVKIGLWLQGQLLLGLVIGVLVYLGLTILSVENALFLAILAALFEIIPIFGPILSAIPSTLIALSDGGLTKGLLVIGLYIIVNQFENHLIYPLVVKKIVGIPPILVIIALIVGFKLAGVLGVILSVPIAAVLVELLDDFHKDKIARVERARATQ